MSVERLKAAQSAYESGDLDLALTFTQKVLRHDPDNGRGWELLGLIHYGQRKFRESVSAIENASALVPLRSVSRVCLALGYTKIGRQELSCDLLVELIDGENLSSPLLLQVATGLDSIQQPGLAVKACRVVLNRHRTHAQAYYDLGYYLGRCGHPLEVIESLARRAIELDPENVCYRVGLAGLLIQQDRPSDAYELVRNFSNKQIREVCCQNCLQRVAELFEAAKDYRRTVLCRKRLLELELSDFESDC